MRNTFSREDPFVSLILITFLILLASDLKSVTGADLVPYSGFVRASAQILLTATLLTRITNSTRFTKDTLIALTFLIALTVYAGFTVFLAGDFFNLSAQRYFLTLGLGTLLIVGLPTVHNNESLVGSLSKIFVWIGVLLTMYATAFSLFSPHARKSELVVAGLQLSQCTLGRPAEIRMCSLTGNPNTFAILLMIATISLVYLIAAHKIRLRYSMMALPILVYGQTLAMSRAGLIATILGVLTLTFLQWTRRRPRWWQITGVVSISLVGGLFTLQSLSGSRLLDIARGLSGRSEVWRILIDSIREVPWIGKGFGISSEAIIQLEDLEISGHNFYLAFASEVGIPATLVFIISWIVIMTLAILQLRSGKHEMLLILALLVAIFAHQFAELKILRFNTLNALFFLLLGVSLPKTKSRRQSNSTTS